MVTDCCKCMQICKGECPESIRCPLDVDASSEKNRSTARERHHHQITAKKNSEKIRNNTLSRYKVLKRKRIKKKKLAKRKKNR